MMFHRAPSISLLLALSACAPDAELDDAAAGVPPPPTLPSLTVWRAVPDFKQDVALNTVAYADGCALRKSDLAGDCQNLFNPAFSGDDGGVLPDALRRQFEPGRYAWCFADPDRMLMGVTDTPALLGDSTQFDARAYECYRDEDPAQEFFEYARLEGSERAQTLRDHPELRDIDHDNRHCQPDGQGPDHACLDRCIQQGLERLDKGFAYRGDLCYPVFGVLTDAWQAQYHCNNHRPAPGDPFAQFYVPGNEFATTYTPAAADEPGYSGGLYGFLPLDPGQRPLGEFSTCSSFVFPHFDVNDGELYAPEIGFVAGLDPAWAAEHFVALDDDADKGKDAVADFVLQKVEGTHQALLGEGGIHFVERLYPAFIERNIVRNAQGRVAARGADGSIHWCAEDGNHHLVQDAVGCRGASHVRAYPKHDTPFVLVARPGGSDKISAGELVNNEAPSFFDAIQMRDPQATRYDYLNQRARLMKPM